MIIFPPDDWTSNQGQIVERARDAAGIMTTEWATCSSFGACVTVAFYASQNDMIDDLDDAESGRATALVEVNPDGTITVL